MSGHPHGHRAKICEVEARDVPHICCFVCVGVGQGEEVLPHLADREEAVVLHDHLSRPLLQGIVYHGPLVVGGGVRLVPDRDQRLARRGVLVPRAGVLGGDVDGHPLPLLLRRLRTRRLLEMANQPGTDVVADANASPHDVDALCRFHRAESSNC